MEENIGGLPVETRHLKPVDLDRAISMSIRAAWVAVGLPLLVGCGGFGPLEIEVEPYDFASTLPLANIGTHKVHISNYRKLLDECGPGNENVVKMYERRVADVSDQVRRSGVIWRDFISSVLAEALLRCLEKQPALIPKECRHRMVEMGGSVSRGGRGVVSLQCGESDILPLEVTFRPLDPTERPQSAPVWGTHLATYSNLDKMLDECGPGVQKAQDLAFSKSSDHVWHAFSRIVDDALIRCLKKRNLIPEACRYGMVPVHNEPVRSFEPKVHFRCEEAATDALSH